MAQGKFSNSRKNPPRKFRVLIPLLAALVLLAAGAGALLLLRGGSQTIAPGVTVSGLPLGGMGRKEAALAVQGAFDPATHPLILSLPGGEISLYREDTGLSLDSRTLLSDALALGRGEAQMWELSLAPYLRLNDAALRSGLEEIARQLAQTRQDTAYTLEGTVPDLREDRMDSGTALPTLAVTLGIPSYAMDVDGAAELVWESLAQGRYTVDLSPALTAQAAPEADAGAILKEITLEPVDAKIDPVSKTAIPGTYGLGCDEKELDRLLKAADPGETVRVPLEAVAPAVMGQEVYFQDTLGFCQTPHSTNEKRNANLKLACAALNGVVLQPGETLSYNATLGQRTEEAGYQKAPAYSGTRLIDSLGGGICQVSSTLYLASLYAELETVERVSHGYPAAYMPVGLDATVNWESPDLKIRNTTDYPIKLVAEVDDGFVYIWIMGTETRDYYVRMAFGSSGDGYARSYYCHYDNQTHALLSKQEAALSGYLSIDTPTMGEIGSSQAYINGNVRDQPAHLPSEETLNAAKDYKEPNTLG